jgi:hypothetical protein
MTNEISPPPLTTTNIKTKIKNKTPPRSMTTDSHKERNSKITPPHNHWQHVEKTDPAKKENKGPHNHTTISHMKQQRTTPKKLNNLQEADPTT